MFDVDGASQRPFLDEQHRYQRHHCDDGGQLEDPGGAVSAGRAHDLCGRGRQGREVRRGTGTFSRDRDAGLLHAGGGQGVDPAGEHGAEHRDADGAAEGTEERHGGAGRADVGRTRLRTPATGFEKSAGGLLTAEKAAC
ncbi:MAG: hypothetical protein ABWX72_10550 [Arthrobacter sp.]